MKISKKFNDDTDVRFIDIRRSKEMFCKFDYGVADDFFM